MNLQTSRPGLCNLMRLILLIVLGMLVAYQKLLFFLKSHPMPSETHRHLFPLHPLVFYYTCAQYSIIENHRVDKYFPKFHQDASHFLLHLQVPCFLYPSIQCIRTLTKIIPASSNSPSVKILQHALLSFFKCPVVCLHPQDLFVLQYTMFALNDHL